MKRFQYNKLCRDKTLDRLKAQKSIPKYKILSHKEYLKALLEKLIEESEEILEAKSKDELIEELADVKELYEAILSTAKISHDSVDKYRQKKIDERGAFKSRIYIEYVDIPTSSPMFKYCLKNKHKYPILPTKK